MINNRPIYRERGITYSSDTCEPLNNAWRLNKIDLQARARMNYPGYRMGKGELTGVNAIGFWNAQHPQEWGLDWHRNEGIEITFLETGNLSFELEQEQYTLGPDNFTITRPWQSHKLGNPNIGIGKLYWIILDVNVRQPHQKWQWPSWIMLSKNDIEELSKMLRQNEQPVWKANSEIRRCFQKIGSFLINNCGSKNETWIKIYINELLMHLITLFRLGPFQHDETLTDSCRTIELFIRDLNNTYYQPWTLESMAEHCDLGVTRFVHYFKLYTNKTPVQYLTYLRMQVAGRELREKPNMNVNQIGYECGFSSSQYFATLFKKQYGCSPVNYRIMY